jgi:hypothetical protein
MLKEEHRSSGVQEFRSSGVQEFRSSGVQDNREFWTCLEIGATSHGASVQLQLFRILGGADDS